MNLSWTAVKKGLISKEQRGAILNGLKSGTEIETKTIHPILKEFHQQWLHGNGKTLGNEGNGGQ